MEQKLVAYFSRFAPLSDEEATAIADSCHIATFPKGTILLREGQISKECYFVLQGCVRQYYLVNGEERTANFFTEEQWVISMNSFTQRIPADHYFSCIEDTVLVIGSEERENDLYRRFPKFEMLSRTVLGIVIAEQQEMQASYITDSPEQRYTRLQNNHPGLVQRVPQYQLASYIGVKPESLSRIRKRLALKKSAAGA